VANMIQLDSEACHKFIYQFAAAEMCQLIHNRSRAHCGAKLFFEGHGRRFNPVDLLFLAACWSSCTRDFGRRRPVRVRRPRGKNGRQSRGTRTEPTWPKPGPARVQPRIRPANGPTGPDPTEDPICRGPTDPDPTEDPTRQWTRGSGSN
jgi:hypothetical protein